MTRRTAAQVLLALPSVRLLAQPASSAPRPDSFRVYSEGPRLLLRPQRLKLLRREKERQSLRWEQFNTLWTANAQFPELGLAQALRYRIDDDRDAGTRAVAWAVGPAGSAPDDIRLIALIADWCEPLFSPDDKTQMAAKLRRSLNDPKPVRTLSDARAKLFAAIVLSEAQPAESERSIQSVFEGFWTGVFLPPLRKAQAGVSNADAYAMLEILHVFRDNLNFDLRETWPQWFGQYPLQHLMAHYPAPFPGAENEYRIPADEQIDKAGPELRKATLSRAAELAMVAYDANAASSQLLQGWLTNDRFLMRGPLGIPYELLWANPYQPGLSYYHVPLALHDELGGQLFVRSSWEDDASWIGFFAGQLQLFKEGEMTRIDPKTATEPIDIDAAVIFFARQASKFSVPLEKSPAEKEIGTSVFLVGLDPRHSFHVEIDGEEMVEAGSDPGGILYLPDVPAGAGVRFSPTALN